MVLLFTLPLASALGSASSVIAALAAILLLPLAIARGGLATMREQPANVIFVGVFVALAICFAITAREPHDVIYVFNFLTLPLAAGIYVIASRGANGATAVTSIAALALACTGVAFGIAFNDIFVRQLPHVYSINLGPHVVARLALIAGFISLAGLFVTRSPWRFVLYLGPALALVVLYLSNTRGAVVALPPLALILAVFLFTSRQDRGQFWVIMAVGLIGIAMTAVASDRIVSIARIAGEIFSGGTTTDGSTLERLAMLDAARQLLPASPFVGHGWASFAAVAHPVIGDAVSFTPDDPFFQFHNDLANFAVAAGSVGILCWLALLAAPIVGALATPRDALFRVRLYCCLQLSVWAAVSGLTDFTLGYDLPTTLYVFLAAIVLGAFRPAASSPPTQRAA